MTTNLTPTEIEELRTCIATEMGWTKLAPYHGNGDIWGIDTAGRLYKVPPYTTSIDAIQSACLERFNGDDKPRFEINFLDPEICNGGKFVHELAALDWCIAFARTSNIWRYKE